MRWASNHHFNLNQPTIAAKKQTIKTKEKTTMARKEKTSINIYEQEAEALNELCCQEDHIADQSEAVMFLLRFYVEHEDTKSSDIIRVIIN